MKRGQVWWPDLAKPQGSEPGMRRPVVIVQDELLTDSKLATVMVVPLTSQMRRGQAMGNVALKSADTGLDKPSVALVCQVLTIDKRLLTELAGSLPRRVMQSVDAGLKLALDLA